MAKNTQQPEVSTSSEAPAETKVVKVTINGQVKDVTCKLVKSGLYSNNSYAYEGEDGNVLFEGYKVKHYCKDNQTFIQDGKGKKTYFDEQGKQIKKPKKEQDLTKKAKNDRISAIKAEIAKLKEDILVKQAELGRILTEE